jgi:hypothetical protein
LSLGQGPSTGREQRQDVQDKPPGFGIVVAEGVVQQGCRQLREFGATDAPFEAAISQRPAVSLAVVDLDMTNAAVI